MTFVLDRRLLLKALGGVITAGAMPATPVRAAALGGRRVIVIGAGIAGLVAALEVEKQGGEAILIEARDRVGGRAWTLRGGDRISHIGQDDQVVGFSAGLHLDAGAARIPSHHDHYLGLAREYGVKLDVLVNSSRSAFIAGNGTARHKGRRGHQGEGQHLRPARSVFRRDHPGAIARASGRVAMMGAEMRAALVRRHVIVAEEQQAIAAGVLDHNLRVACIAHALLNAQPVPPASVAAPSVAIIAQRARQDNMWARLGLGHEPINGIPKVAEACFSSPEGDCHGAV